MKLSTKYLPVGVLLLFLTSCTDYLDVVPDNTLTIEDLFKQKEEAWDALAKSYSYLPQIDETHTSMWTAGDEWLGRLDLNENTNHLRGIRLMRGVQSVSNPILGCWSGTNAGQPLYEGIRQTNVFLENTLKLDRPGKARTAGKGTLAHVHFGTDIRRSTERDPWHDGP